MISNGEPDRSDRRRVGPMLLMVVALAAVLGVWHVLDEPAVPSKAATTRPGAKVAASREAPRTGTAWPYLEMAEAMAARWEADKVLSMRVDSGTGVATAEDWNARWEGEYLASIVCVGEGSVTVSLGRTREATRELDAGVRVSCTTPTGGLGSAQLTLHLGCLCARVVPGPETSAAVAIAVRPVPPAEILIRQ
ncbi:hypothetical protein GCM10009682_39750 [Luedemannella flava]|uniref:Uncharacterized protein n=1 Tax=Luedemannella flava TaxID=349316 RepID=A0ABP4YFA7_9ACTN